MLRHAPVAHLLFVAITLAACGTRDRPRGRPANGTDGGVRDAAADSGVPRVATECLEEASCVDTSDCPSGSRCNFTLVPPKCQRLFCGGPGTACSEDSLCLAMHLCSEASCRACVDCSGTCVLTESDEAHCGGCNMPVRFDQVCENGVPVCADDSTECGGECVFLDTSVAHCGACNRACSASCLGGQCVEPVGVQGTNPMSCATVCSTQRQTACAVVSEIPLPEMTAMGAGVALYDDMTTQEFYVVATCEETPPATQNGLPYTALLCYCRVD